MSRQNRQQTQSAESQFMVTKRIMGDTYVSQIVTALKKNDLGKLYSLEKILVDNNVHDEAQILSQFIENNRPAIADQFDSNYLMDLNEDQISTLSDLGLGCPKNKIMDPLTRRCIVICGQIGQKIIQMIKANDGSFDEYYESA